MRRLRLSGDTTQPTPCQRDPHCEVTRVKKRLDDRHVKMHSKLGPKTPGRPVRYLRPCLREQMYNPSSYVMQGMFESSKRGSGRS